MQMPFRNLLLVAAVAGITAGCTTVTQTQPAQTATQQLLISTAADHAIKRLKVDLPAGTAVFLDTSDFQSYDQKYVIGAIKDHLLKSGLRLVADRAKADVIVDVRSGALSINKSETLVGLPATEIPLPLSSGPLKTPEIALFKDARQRGIAKFAMTTYDAKDGSLRASSGPVYGFSHRTKWVVLLFVSWTTDDLTPKDKKL